MSYQELLRPAPQPQQAPQDAEPATAEPQDGEQALRVSALTKQFERDAQKRKERRGKLRVGEMAATMYTPAQVSEADRLSKQTRLPTSVTLPAVRDNPELSRRLTDKDMDTLWDRDPLMAEWLSDPANFAAAHEDLPTLASIHYVLGSQARNDGFWEDMWDAGGIGTLDVESSTALTGALFGYRSLDEAAQHIAMAQKRRAEMEQGMSADYRAYVRRLNRQKSIWGYAAVRLSELDMLAIENAKQAANSLIPLTAGFVGGKVGAGAGLLTGPLAPAAVPVLGVGGMVAGVGAGTYVVEYGATMLQQLSEAGVDLTDAEQILKKLREPGVMETMRGAANRKALGTSAVEAFFAALPAKGLNRALGAPKRSIARIGAQALKHQALEMGGESLGEGVGQFYQYEGDISQMSGREILDEGLISGFQSGGTTALKTMVDQGGPAAVRVLRDVVTAESDAEVTETVVRDWTKLKNARLIGPRLRELMQKIAGRSGISTVRIDRPVLEEYQPEQEGGFSPAQFVEDVTGSTQAWFDSEATGEVGMDFYDVVDKVGGTPHFGALLPKMRFRDDGVTLEEAQQLLKEQLERQKAAFEEAQKLEGTDVDAIDAEIEALQRELAGLQRILRDRARAGMAPPEDEQQAQAQQRAPRVGDLVQWTSQGVDQFAEPKRIRDIQQGYVLFEGENTGVPLSEVRLVNTGDQGGPDGSPLAQGALGESYWLVGGVLEPAHTLHENFVVENPERFGVDPLADKDPVQAAIERGATRVRLANKTAWVEGVGDPNPMLKRAQEVLDKLPDSALRQLQWVTFTTSEGAIRASVEDVLNARTVRDLPGGRLGQAAVPRGRSGYETFVARLRSLRERAGRSLRSVAKTIGVAPATLHNIETGKRQISQKAASALGDLFDLPAGEREALRQLAVFQAGTRTGGAAAERIAAAAWLDAYFKSQPEVYGDKPISVLLGQLRARREAAGKGVRELARELGVSPSLITHVEKGQKSGTAQLFRSMADAIGMQGYQRDALEHLANLGVLGRPEAAAVAAIEAGAWLSDYFDSAAQGDTSLRGYDVPRGADEEAAVPDAERGDADVADADVAGLHTATRMVEQGTREVGAGPIRSARDAASALSFLSEHPEEHVEVLLVDRDGRPLAVVGAFKGGVSETFAPHSVLVSEMYRVPGAVEAWIGHNHPSGSSVLSQQDLDMLRSVHHFTRGSGITVRGIFAVGGQRAGGRTWHFADTDGNLSNGVTEAREGAATVPVLERRFETENIAPAAQVLNPDDAVAAAEELSGGQSGVILLDTQLRPVGFIPIEAAAAAELRTDQRMDRLYRAISHTAARASIVVSSGRQDLLAQATATGAPAVANLVGFLNSVGLGPVDIIAIEENGDARSFVEDGNKIPPITEFYQEGVPAEPGQGAEAQTAQAAPGEQAAADTAALEQRRTEIEKRLAELRKEKGEATAVQSAVDRITDTLVKAGTHEPAEAREAAQLHVRIMVSLSRGKDGAFRPAQFQYMAERLTHAISGEAPAAPTPETRAQDARPFDGPEVAKTPLVGAAQREFASELAASADVPLRELDAIADDIPAYWLTDDGRIVGLLETDEEGVNSPGATHAVFARDIDPSLPSGDPDIASSEFAAKSGAVRLTWLLDESGPSELFIKTGPEGLSPAQQRAVRGIVRELLAQRMDNNEMSVYIESLDASGSIIERDEGRVPDLARLLGEYGYGGTRVDADAAPHATVPATIDVDGQQRPTMNSDGQPIHWSVEGVRNFWRWAMEDGNQPLTDDSGRPLALLRGLRHEGGEAEAFEGRGVFAAGARATISLTPSADAAAIYATTPDASRLVGFGEHARIAPMYVRAKRVLDLRGKGATVTLRDLVEATGGLLLDDQGLGTTDLAWRPRDWRGDGWRTGDLWSLITSFDEMAQFGPPFEGTAKYAGVDPLFDAIGAATSAKDLEARLLDWLGRLTVDAFALGDNQEMVSRLSSDFGIDLIRHDDTLEAFERRAVARAGDVPATPDTYETVRPFAATQVKSAIGNTGEFGPGPSILNQEQPSGGMDALQGFPDEAVAETWQRPSMPSAPTAAVPLQEYNARAEVLGVLEEEGYLPAYILDALTRDRPLAANDVADVEAALERAGDYRHWSEILSEHEDDVEAEPWEAPADLDDYAALVMGTTDDPIEAGYILRDGRMLDFSGKREGGSGQQRVMDHREIGVEFAGVDGGSATMVAWMNASGAARVDFGTGLFEVQVFPSPAQMRAAVEAAEDLGIELELQASAPSGSEIVSSTMRTPRVGSMRRFYSGGGSALFQPPAPRRTTLYQGAPLNITPNPSWFYSDAAAELRGFSDQTSARTGKQWSEWLKKRQTVKNEEVFWTGIDLLPEDVLLTAAQAAKFIEQNGVRLQGIRTRKHESYYERGATGRIGNFNIDLIVLEGQGRLPRRFPFKTPRVHFDVDDVVLHLTHGTLKDADTGEDAYVMIEDQSDVHQGARRNPYLSEQESQMPVSGRKTEIVRREVTETVTDPNVAAEEWDPDADDMYQALLEDESEAEADLDERRRELEDYRETLSEWEERRNNAQAEVDYQNSELDDRIEEWADRKEDWQEEFDAAREALDSYVRLHEGQAWLFAESGDPTKARLQAAVRDLEFEADEYKAAIASAEVDLEEAQATYAEADAEYDAYDDRVAAAADDFDAAARLLQVAGEEAEAYARERRGQRTITRVVEEERILPWTPPAGTPLTPYRKNEAWGSLGLRIQLARAAREGYSQFDWVPGWVSGTYSGRAQAVGRVVLMEVTPPAPGATATVSPRPGGPLLTYYGSPITLEDIEASATTWDTTLAGTPVGVELEATGPLAHNMTFRQIAVLTDAVKIAREAVAGTPSPADIIAALQTIQEGNYSTEIQEAATAFIRMMREQASDDTFMFAGIRNQPARRLRDVEAYPIPIHVVQGLRSADERVAEMGMTWLALMSLKAAIAAARDTLNIEPDAPVTAHDVSIGAQRAADAPPSVYLAWIEDNAVRNDVRTMLRQHAGHILTPAEHQAMHSTGGPPAAPYSATQKEYHAAIMAPDGRVIRDYRAKSKEDLEGWMEELTGTAEPVEALLGQLAETDDLKSVIGGTPMWNTAPQRHGATVRVAQDTGEGLFRKIDEEELKNLQRFYDGVLVKEARKIAKRYGVELTKGRLISNAAGKQVLQTWRIPITEQMRREIEAVGVSLFQDAPGMDPLSEAMQPQQPGDQGPAGEGGEERGFIAWAGRGLSRLFNINFLRNADKSTFFHESAHYYLEIMGDLQRDPNIHDDIREDYRRILSWLGVETHAEITREHHERFARAFEKWLGEGVAPTPELVPVFKRFSRWMRDIYGEVLRRLNVELTDELREVFARMVAAADSVAEVEAVEGAVPLFSSEEAALEQGMTREEYQEWSAAREAAREESAQRVQRRLMRETSRKAKEARENLLERYRAQVREEIQKEPAVRALSVMQTGKEPGGGSPATGNGNVKLDRKTLEQVYKPQEQVMQQLGDLGVLGDKGAYSPEAVAQMFGIESGEALIQGVIEAADMDAAIERRAQALLRAQHPSLMRPAALRALSRQEVEARSDLKALEIERRFLERKLAEQKRATGRAERRAERAEGAAKEADVEARARRADRRRELGRVMTARLAKEEAMRLIGGLTLRELKPYAYLSSARRHSRMAVQLARQNDWVGVRKAKDMELVNHEMHALARRRLKAMEAAVRRLKKTQTASRQSELGLAGWSYRDQINALLERVDLRRVSKPQAERRLALAEWVAEREKDTEIRLDIDERLLDEAYRKPYLDMTYDELIALRDAVVQMDTLATNKRKLMDARDKRELAELDAALAAQVASSREGKPVQDERPSGLEAVTHSISTAYATLVKLSTWAREMDGNRDNGLVFKTFVRRLNEAAATKALMVGDAAERYLALLRMYTRKERRGWRRKQLVPGTKRSLSWAGRLSFALNWANAGNRQRLLDGNNFTEEDAQAILATLDGRDWDFVEGVLELLDSYWDAIAAKEQRTVGVVPQRVEPAPFTVTVDGKEREIRGGYYPIEYGDVRAEDQDKAEIAKRVMRGAYARATTRRGYTKARQREVVGRPILLDLGVIGKHLDEVIQDLSHHEALIDINRLLNAPKLTAAVTQHYGAHVLQELKDLMVDVAAGHLQSADGLERKINYLRTGASVSMLSWKAMTSVINITGLLQSAVQVGPRWVYFGARKWLAGERSIRGTVEWVHGKSRVMASRSDTLMRELNEMMNDVTKADQRPWRALQFWTIAITQLAVDMPTWLGAYEKALSEGAADADAVAIADNAVKQSQGGGDIVDLARVQRGGPFKKLFTTFYFYSSTTLQLAHGIGSQFRQSSDPHRLVRLVGQGLLLITLPALIETVLRGLLQGRPDDDDGWEDIALDAAGEHIGIGLGMVPFLGTELRGAVSGWWDYDGPAGARVIPTLLKAGQETVKWDLDWQQAKSYIQLAGIVGQLPAEQAVKTLEGLHAIYSGEVSGPRAALAPLFGAPRRY